MYKLKVTAEKIDGYCNQPILVGDSFIVDDDGMGGGGHGHGVGFGCAGVIVGACPGRNPPTGIGVRSQVDRLQVSEVSFCAAA